MPFSFSSSSSSSSSSSFFSYFLFFIFPFIFLFSPVIYSQPVEETRWKADVKIFNRKGELIRNTLNSNGNHENNIKLKISFDGISTSINLVINKYLVSDNFVTKWLKQNETIITKYNLKNKYCYYLGKEKEREESKLFSAAFSTCIAPKGVFSVGNKSYYLKFEKNYSSSSSSSSYIFYVVKYQEKTHSGPTCGVVSFKNETDRGAYLPNPMEKVFNNMKVIELYVANDFSRVSSFTGNQNRESLVEDTLAIVNTANLIYQPQGFYVVLNGMENWEEINKCGVSPNYKQTLENWTKYRNKHVLPFHYHDAGYLISRVKFFDSILGYAYLESMCGSKSTGIISSQKDLTEGFGSVLAHELGHNLGLYHDNINCHCSEKNNLCVMYSSINLYSPPKLFSQCSEDNLLEGSSYFFYSCLHNFPKLASQNSGYCGNGIIEDGEECDCGNLDPQICNSNCCDSCFLTKSAQCAQGSCCHVNSCKIKQQGNKCRKSSDECDISEYCDGKNSICSGDIYKHDGVQCLAGYCFQGKCRNRMNQCKDLYGISKPDIQGESKSKLCSFSFSSSGLKLEDCKEDEDPMCGVLWCYGNINIPYKFNRKKKISYSNSLKFQMTSVFYDLGPQVLNPGLVFNGSPCEKNKACLNSSCVEVDNFLNINPCPPCLNGGVCTNLGICLCKNNYGGDSCEILTPGEITTPIISNTTTTITSTTPITTHTTTTTTITTTSTTTTTTTTTSTTTTTTTTTSTTTTTKKIKFTTTTKFNNVKNFSFFSSSPSTSSRPIFLSTSFKMKNLKLPKFSSSQNLLANIYIIFGAVFFSFIYFLF